MVTWSLLIGSRDRLRTGGFRKPANTLPETSESAGRHLEEPRAAGDLPAECSPADLARYIMTVAHGMAIQASSGASREALYAVVGMTLKAWPSA